MNTHTQDTELAAAQDAVVEARGGAAETQSGAAGTQGAVVEAQDTTAEAQRTPARAALASFVGSVVEYYDFFIFGSAAALIFPELFFGANSQTALVLSFATFGSAYIARPVGALVLGHFGDKLGRKNMLMLTLLIMGAATFGIGCLPTYDQLGVTAPLLLAVLRLCQGFSAGGEAAGAASLTLEHSPSGRRSFFASWTMTGAQGGQILAALVFIPIMSLPDEIKLTWGWRIPFLLSAVVVVVAYVIRRSLTEAPEFKRARQALGQPEAGEGARAAQVQVPGQATTAAAAAANRLTLTPVVELLTHHWRAVIRVILCALIAGVSTVFGNLALAYGSSEGLTQTTTLWLVVVANVVALGTQPLFGMLADRIGRKPVFIYGCLSPALAMPFYLMSMSQGNLALCFALAVLTFSFCYAASNAVWPSFYPEMFPTKVRYSGMALGTQIGFIMAGFTPTIVSAFGGAEAGGWPVISVFTAIICVIAAAAACTAAETKDIPTAQLGERSPRTATPPGKHLPQDAPQPSKRTTQDAPQLGERTTQDATQPSKRTTQDATQLGERTARDAPPQNEHTNV